MQSPPTNTNLTSDRPHLLPPPSGTYVTNSMRLGYKLDIQGRLEVGPETGLTPRLLLAMLFFTVVGIVLFGFGFWLAIRKQNDELIVTLVFISLIAFGGMYAPLLISRSRARAEGPILRFDPNTSTIELPRLKRIVCPTQFESIDVVAGYFLIAGPGNKSYYRVHQVIARINDGRDLELVVLYANAPSVPDAVVQAIERNIQVPVRQKYLPMNEAVEITTAMGCI